MDELTREDHPLIEIINVDRRTASFAIEHMDSIELDTECEQLQRQIEQLTIQLNQSKSSEKHSNDEREKYFQLYNQTKERFLVFEHQQLDQIRRILNILNSDQPETLSQNGDQSSHSDESFPTPLTSLDQSLQTTTDLDWNQLLKQICELMDVTEQLTTKCYEQSEENVQLHDDISFLQSEYETEKQMRQQFEKQLNEANKLIEMDHSKRIQKLRNYASLADDEGDILLSSLMKKAEKNDIDFGEMKYQYENVFTEQVNQINKLVKERELLHLYIQRLQRENNSLASRTNYDQTIQLLTHSSQIPHSFEDASKLINQLRNEIIEQIKVQDKLRNDIQQLQYNHQTDLREREQIEGLLQRDLNAAKDQILLLESVRSEYEHVLKLKSRLEREVEEYTNELITLKTTTNCVLDHLKEQTEQISLEKETLDEENVKLRLQIQKLKVDFENSESVQHDFVKLSQALQVQLEEFRNAGNELRWQAEEDFSECQRCHSAFSVTWRKYHCRHCGKVLCKECVNKTISSGPNNRPSRVCNVCYTLLNKTSQPYFLAGVPEV